MGTRCPTTSCIRTQACFLAKCATTKPRLWGWSKSRSCCLKAPPVLCCTTGAPPDSPTTTAALRRCPRCRTIHLQVLRRLTRHLRARLHRPHHRCLLPLHRSILRCHPFRLLQGFVTSRGPDSPTQRIVALRIHCLPLKADPKVDRFARIRCAWQKNVWRHASMGSRR